MGRTDSTQRYENRHHKRAKYLCQACDKVVKGKRPSRCPSCGADMTPMGTQWRPGRRGSRTRMWDRRQDHHFEGYEPPLHSRPSLELQERRTWPRPPRRIGRKQARARREAAGQRPVPRYRQPWTRPWWLS